MNLLANKVCPTYQKSAPAVGLSAPPIGCVLELPGLPGGGNKIYDRSPYGNHGTIIGAVWQRLPSGLWYLDFDGTDDYVTKASNVYGMPNGGEFSVEFWVKCDREGTREWFIGCGDTSNGYVWFGVSHETTKKFKLFYGNALNNHYACLWTSADDFPINSYQHIVCTYNKTWSTRTLVYLNGIYWAGSDTGIGGDVNTPTTYLTIGTRRTGAVYELDFDGVIALPRVYNRALSGFDAMKHFQQEKHLFGVW